MPPLRPDLRQALAMIETARERERADADLRDRIDLRLDQIAKDVAESRRLQTELSAQFAAHARDDERRLAALEGAREADATQRNHRLQALEAAALVRVDGKIERVDAIRADWSTWATRLVVGGVVSLVVGILVAILVKVLKG